MNIPKIRFPGFGGQREEKKLGEFISIKSGKYDSQKSKENLKCIELEHLESESGRLLGFIESKQTNSTKNLFKSQQVLFGKLRPYLKKFYFTNFDGVCSSEIWVMNGKEVENKFLYYFVQTDFFLTLTDKSTGSKMPRADWSIISNEIGLLPTLEEQKKIANFLFSVDEKINNLANQLEKWKEYKKGIMQKIFSQKIRFKKDNGENFDDWQEKKLGEFLKQKSIRNKNLEINQVLSVSNKKGFITQDEQFDGYEVASKDLSNYKIVEKGDFAYNPSRINVGSIALLKDFENGIVSPMYIIFKLNGLNNNFFENLIKTYKFKFLVKTSTAGSVRESLNFDILESFKFLLPSLEEQEKISNFLTSIDEKIENIEKQLEKSRTWKKGLLQNLFV